MRWAEQQEEQRAAQLVERRAEQLEVLSVVQLAEQRGVLSVARQEGPLEPHKCQY